MENLENFEPIEMRYRDKLRMKFIDRFPRKYERVSVMAAALAASVLTPLLVHHELTYEPTYQDRLEAEYLEFLDCLATEPSFASNHSVFPRDLNRQIDLQFAFPEYEMDSEFQATIDQCRLEHPMPRE